MNAAWVVTPLDQGERMMAGFERRLASGLGRETLQSRGEESIVSDETEDVAEVEKVSDDLLRVTIGDVTTEVYIERKYRIQDHFGEFRSLDDVIGVLRAIQRDS